ncbi:HD domain-containing protein [Solimonas flava]|uniref:HD domain-containing protein n=1 Tax=Solimonas flava TaxID=415849 RepID=UPI0004863116|nr:N-methyl-D-aspartate receptor NMDAR2C subunit [Solimonas flava]
MNLHEHWLESWRQLGASATDESLYLQLVACYSEPHRHYHTVQHLTECLALLEAVEDQADRPAEVAIALWFHDAVYQPKRHDNEQKSADWASRSILAAGIDHSVADRIHGLILATRHNAAATGRDAQVLVDIDLAILGASPERFAEYEAQVRKEYAWAIGPLYRRGRRKVLEEFMARPTIYSTESFRSTREAQARINISRSLAALR